MYYFDENGSRNGSLTPVFLVTRAECERFATRSPVALDEKQRKALARKIYAFYRDPENVAKLDGANRKSFLDIYRSTSLFCLSERPDSITMWSYYASDHRGLCTGFSLREPWISEVNQLGDRVKMDCERVRYSKRYPSINHGVDLRAKGAGKNHIDMALLTKAIDWKHEAEWRCLRPATKSGAQSFPPSALRQLIFGARMGPKRKQEIVALARQRGRPLELYQACLSKNTYGIEFEPIMW